MFAYQVIAVILFVFGLVLANRWLQQPFLGALYEHTLVFNGTGPRDVIPAWALFGEVVVGDQLIAINGIPVKSAEEIHTILQGYFPGEAGKCYCTSRKRCGPRIDNYFILLSRHPVEQFILLSQRY